MLSQFDIYIKKMNLNPHLKLYIKINSRLIIDINMKNKAIKLLEKIQYIHDLQTKISMKEVDKKHHEGKYLTNWTTLKKLFFINGHH